MWKLNKKNLADTKEGCFFCLRTSRVFLVYAIVFLIMGGGVFALPAPGSDEAREIPPQQIMWVFLCTLFLSLGVLLTCSDSFEEVKSFLLPGWTSDSFSDKEVALMEHFPRMSTIRSLGIIDVNLTLLLLTFAVDICLWSDSIPLGRWCWITFILAICWSFLMLILLAGYRLFLHLTDFREAAQPILPGV